jgi:hypothetical protein
MAGHRIRTLPRSKPKSASRSRSLWNRWTSHLPPGTAAGLGFTALIVIGALLYPARPNEGTAILVVGGIGIGWQGRLWLLAWKARQTAKAEASRRLKQQGVRHARQETERQEREKQKQNAAFAGLRAKEAEEARRAALRQQSKAQQALRTNREQAVTRESERLLALPDEARLPAVSEAFRKRGLLPQTISDEAQCDLLLTSDSGEVRAIARLVPRERMAEPADVRALEEWRKGQGAETAYLISFAGFSPSALREAKRVPVTLVEAHLLAHWSIPGKESRNDT